LNKAFTPSLPASFANNAGTPAPRVTTAPTISSAAISVYPPHSNADEHESRNRESQPIESTNQDAPPIVKPSTIPYAKFE
jgi:hypothetical protein